MDAGRSPDETLPAWLASKISRAAAFSVFYWSLPFAAVTALFVGVALMLLFGNPESKAVPIFWMAVFLVAIYLFSKELATSFGNFFHPGRSEEATYLRGLGPLDQTMEQIELELQDAANLNYPKKVVITKNWVIITDGHRFAVRPLDNLIWVYLKKTTTKLNWVVPIWRTNAVVFRSAGPDAEATCHMEWGTKFLNRISERCPWLVLGHSEEQEKLWDSDRTSFIAAVQERKKLGMTALD